MMHQKHASLRLRLALLFALASAVLFALMGFYVFNALEREVAYRDDMALLGRIDRIENRRIQTRSATPVDSVNEGGVLRAVDQQFSVHSQR